MRPLGEIRLMAARSLEQLVRERRQAQARASGPSLAVPGATWRDVAECLRPLGVAPHATRATLKNMARAGVIQPVGQVRVADSARALTAFAPAASLDDSLLVSTR